MPRGTARVGVAHIQKDGRIIHAIANQIVRRDRAESAYLLGIRDVGQIQCYGPPAIRVSTRADEIEKWNPWDGYGPQVRSLRQSDACHQPAISLARHSQRAWRG